LQAINNLAKHGSSRKLVLLLLTLKNDPGEYPFSKVKDALRENNILFYSTAVPSRPELPYDVGTRNLMKDLAELSGGDFFFPTIASQLEGIYQNIARELRYQYVIGYRPKKAADGEWRKIKVTAEIADGKKVTKIDLRTRQGYYARTAATSTPAKK
jgi:Ca-activated chloride channel family protein